VAGMVQNRVTLFLDNTVLGTMTYCLMDIWQNNEGASYVVNKRRQSPTQSITYIRFVISFFRSLQCGPDLLEKDSVLLPGNRAI